MKKKFFLITIIIVLGIIFVISSVSIEEKRPSLIRLHILANSNQAADQMVKYRLRDRLVEMIGEKMKNVTSLEESRRIIMENLTGIEEYAEEILQECGKNQDVQVYHGFFDFPAKYYGSFALSAGNYEALRIVIGRGEGANWWCVLFPPLCFVEGKTKKVHTEEETLKAITDAAQQKKTVRFKPALKILELIRREK